MLERQFEMEEKKSVSENDRLVRDQTGTFMSHTHDDTGGRFRTISNPTIVGATEVPQYPKAADWVSVQLPDELPTGQNINALEPVGEPHELKASVPPPLQSSVISSVGATEPSPAPSPSSPRGERHGLGSLSHKSYRRF